MGNRQEEIEKVILAVRQTIDSLDDQQTEVTNGDLNEDTIRIINPTGEPAESGRGSRSSMPADTSAAVQTREDGLLEGMSIYRRTPLSFQRPPEEFFHSGYLGDENRAIRDTLIRVVRQKGPIHKTVADRMTVSHWQLRKAGIAFRRE